MELKIKVKKGNYALRTFDKDGLQIFYTSTRLNGLGYDDNNITCTVPDLSAKYELKDLTTKNIVAEGEIDKPKPEAKNVHNK